jgi:hypothetical protein
MTTYVSNAEQLELWEYKKGSTFGIGDHPEEENTKIIYGLIMGIKWGIIKNYKQENEEIIFDEDKIRFLEE